MARRGLSEYQRDILEVAAEDDYGLWELNPSGWSRTRDRELIRADVLCLLDEGFLEVVRFDGPREDETVVSAEQARELIHADEYWRADIGRAEVQVRVRTTAAGETALRDA